MNVSKFTELKKGSRLSMNLKELMGQKEITLSILSKSTGVPIGTVSRLLSDDLQNPTIASLAPLAKFFHITIDQLIGMEPLTNTSESQAQLANNKRPSIPLITWEDAVNWVDEKQHKVYLYQHTVVTDLQLSPNAYALSIEHDDWQFFPRGTVLIIEPFLEPKNRDYIIVTKTESKNKIPSTLRQLLMDGDEKYLKPLNPEFKITPLTTEDKILGVMKQSRRDY